jgi:hypothetical protein
MRKEYCSWCVWPGIVARTLSNISRHEECNQQQVQRHNSVNWFCGTQWCEASPENQYDGASKECKRSVKVQVRSKNPEAIYKARCQKTRDNRRRNHRHVTLMASGRTRVHAWSLIQVSSWLKMNTSSFGHEEEESFFYDYNSEFPARRICVCSCSQMGYVHLKSGGRMRYVPILTLLCAP